MRAATKNGAGTAAGSVLVGLCVGGTQTGSGVTVGSSREQAGGGLFQETERRDKRPMYRFGPKALTRVNGGLNLVL